MLARLRATGGAEDEAGEARVRARESELGRRVYRSERAELYGPAPIGITAAVGELLYLLVLARRPAVVVEFRASHGGSTIYLAAAVRDVGAGRIVTAELRPGRALVARENLPAPDSTSSSSSARETPATPWRASRCAAADVRC